MTARSLMVRGLRKHYGARQVVQDESLRLDSGEVIGLLGPNGAGKTTSFYMIVGLVPSDAGEIDLDGVNISRLPIHRRSALGLSYLPQEPSIFRKLTVKDNIPGGARIAISGRQELVACFDRVAVECLAGRPASREAAHKPRAVAIRRRTQTGGDSACASDQAALPVA